MPSCSAGTATIIGDGMGNNNWFNPANADTGIVQLIVYGEYALDTSISFSPISGNGTLVYLSDDQVSNALPIGFSFKFFENTYTQFRISSNGFITFDNTTANGCCSGQALPNSSDPNNLIAAAWEDLDPPEGGTIEYFTTGTSPNQVLCVNFNTIQHYPSGNAVTFQIQLHEGCGRIEIHTTTMPTDGGLHTMGLENSDGTEAIVYPNRNASSWSTSNEVVAWEPACPDTFYTYVSAGPDVVVSADTSDCYGDSTASATATASGSSPFTYLWPNGQTTMSATGLGTGSQVVTVTDAAGCSTFASFNVVSPQQITSNATVTDANCSNSSDGSIAMSYAGGTTPYSYSWSSGATSASLNNIAAGTYSVTLTDANGCTHERTETVDYDHEAPIVDLGDDKGKCPGNVALLVVTPGYASYAWSNGGTASSTVVTTPGTYSVTVTTSDGCTGSDDILVYEFVPDQVDLGPNLSGPAPIVLDAGSQFTQFTWSTGATSQTINVLNSGTYTVTVADSNGCTSNDQVGVSIWPASVSELDDGALVVFPNPTSAVLNVLAGQNLGSSALQLHDATGRLVRELTMEIKDQQMIQIDVTDLVAGHYMLTITSDEGLFKRNIVVH